jgi:hypothetical protein
MRSLRTILRQSIPGWAAGVIALLGSGATAALGADAGANPPTPPPPPVRERNMPLAAAPPAPSPATAISNSVPDLLLTGIVELSGKKWAALLRANRGQPPEQYLLKEGETKDGLEIVAIDVRAEKVTVRHAGGEVLLNFRTHGRPAAEQALVAEKQFVDDHTRAHELHEQRERERIARERAEVQAIQPSSVPAPPANGEDPNGSPVLPGAIRSVTFSPDGTRILTGSENNVRVWDVVTGRPLEERPAR